MSRTINAAMTVAGSETGNLEASFNTDPFRIENFDGFSLSAVVTGASSLDGTLKLQGSNDMGASAGTGGAGIRGVTNWFDLSGTETINANGIKAWNHTNAWFRWVRVVYTRVGGSGSLALRINAKGV
jgi:hypothetical protein